MSCLVTLLTRTGSGAVLWLRLLLPSYLAAYHGEFSVFISHLSLHSDCYFEIYH